MQTRAHTSILCALALALGVAPLACGDDADAPPPVALAPTPPPKEADADEAAGETQARAARAAPAAPAAPSGPVALAAAGHHGAAVAEVQAALAASATDDQLWRVLGRSAVAADQAAAVYEALDAGAALGGRAGPHHLLRAELALARGRAADAVAAAGFAAADDPAGAVGVLAMAARAGARVPASAAGGDPAAQALLALAGARGAAGAAKAGEAAGAGGWRGALVRGEVLEAAGEGAAAIEAYAQAAGDADPRGAVHGNLGRARVALAGGDAGQALAWAREAGAAAAKDADAPGAAAAIDLAARAGLAGGDLAGALTAAREVSDALAATAGGSVAPEVGAAACRSALLLGAPAEALATGEVSVLGLPEQAPPAAAAARALAATVAFEAGEAAAVARVVEAAGGAPEGSAAAAVGAIARGERGAVPALDGLDPVDAALVGLVAAEAHVDPAARSAALQRAAQAAAAADLPTLRLATHLAWETAARAAGELDQARAARAALAELAATSPALQAELAARALLAGESATLPAEGVGAWQALVAGVAPPAEDGGMQAAVAAFASARALAGQGKRADAAKAYLDAHSALPTHRYGRLSLGTVLDGSTGLPLSWELERNEALVGESAPTIVFAAHEVQHRVDDVNRQVSAGRTMLEGLPPASAAPLAEAAAAARLATARWLLGGAAPDLAALQAAEAQALAEPGLARLAPRAAVAAEELANATTGDALVSYVRFGGRLHGAALSSRGFAVADLGAADRLLAQVEAHTAALTGQGNAAPTGNTVRAALVDPFAEQLAGVARYIVVGPAPLLRFGLATVPEQADALRWLEDIRDVAVAPTVGSLQRPQQEPRPYAPDLLALGLPGEGEGIAKEGGSEEGAKKASKGGKAGLDAYEELLPGEVSRGWSAYSSLPAPLAAAVRTYGKGRRQVLVGADASLAAWQAGAPNARVVQVHDVAAAPGGGFTLADGELDLATIRSTPMQADLVILTAMAPVDVQVLRAQAFLDAGARQVMVQTWEVPEEAVIRYIDAFFEAMNQERPALRAMEQGRLAVRNDPLQTATFSRPNVWGAFLLVGHP